MQYALVEINSRAFLVDAHEVRSIETYGPDSIADSPKPDEQVAPLLVCYGAYLPQHGASSEKALVDLLGAKGTWLGSISESICQLIAVQDIRAFGFVKVGQQDRIPFAVLIQAHEALSDRIKGGDAQAVTAFIRYANMSPADNLLNRQGVFALQAVERRVAEAPTLEGWAGSIDRARAQRIARKIK